MTFFKRLFGRGSEEPADVPTEAPAPAAPAAFSAGSPPVASIDVDALLEGMASQLFEVIHEGADPDVTRARIADLYRDLGIEPMDPLEFEAHAAGLDAAAWIRVATLAGAVEDDEALGEALVALHPGGSAAEQVKSAFLNLARETPLLTLELLLSSPLRLEELARRFIAALGATVDGEEPEESWAALVRLDYGRLLAEVDRAKLSAEQRMEYLRKLQEQQEAARPRRGKW